MSPFSFYFHDLRMRPGIRQTDLAKLVGYEQAYLSALEIGIKGPPNEALITKLIDALELDEREQTKLKSAVHESKRKYTLSSDMPMETFKMVSELWDELEDLHPEQIQMIRAITRFKKQLNKTSLPGRFRIARRQKEEAKM